MPHHIFLSYSRADETLMRQVYDHLTRAGFLVWIDQTGIPPGTTSWKRAIQTAIDESQCLVVIFSPEAKGSKWVGEELDYAEAQQKPIFPILARGNSTNAVPFGYSSSQWVDIRGKQNIHSEMRKLAEEVSKRINLLLKPTAPSTASPIDISRTAIEDGVSSPPQESEPQLKQYIHSKPLHQSEPKPSTPSLPINSNQSTNQPPKRLTLTPIKRVLAQYSLAKPLEQQIAQPVAIKSLIPLIDQFRLLWWLFIQPEKYIYYQNQVGEKTTKNAGTWLASTLTWLPLFISTLATSLNVMPAISTPLNTHFEVWSAILILAWLLTVWLGNQNDTSFGIMGVIAFSIAGVITGVMAFVITGDITGGVAVDGIGFAIALGIAGVIALVIMGLITGVIARGIAFGVAFSGAGIVISIVAGIVTSIITVAISVAISVAVAGVVTFAISRITKANLKTHQSSLLSKLIFIFLILSYATLIWIYWLGGWRVL